MFNTGWHSEKDNQEDPKAKVKPAPRFSPKIVASIHGRPLNDYTKERVFDDERPQPSPGKSTTPKKQKPMQLAAAPVMEAGTPPEGIQSTKNYSQFKFLSVNRKPDPAHVRRLMAAIRKKNLLHLNPIVVNAHMEIIDGQHRLEAAKALGVAIFYTQDQSITWDDIAGMNSNKKNWGLMDYINFYAEQDVEAYVEFLKLCKKNPAIHPSVLKGMCAGEKSKGGYREGHLDISRMDEAKTTISHLADYSDHFSMAYTARFIEAVSFLVRSGLYDHEHMKKKLEQNPGMLQPCANTKQYIESLERIYNRMMRDENIVIFLKRR